MPKKTGTKKKLSSKFQLWRDACKSVMQGIPQKDTQNYKFVKHNYDELVSGVKYDDLTYKAKDKKLNLKIKIKK